MNIAEITVGDRARTQMGWLDPLERSIEARGLLQPIGVTSEGELIFGARRLQACKNLGWTDIPVTVVNIDASDPASSIKAERDENEVRKDFTPMEKVAIAQKIEETLAGRVGNPQLGKHLPNCEDKPQGKSTDIAAEAVGWSGEQYRQAKHVAEHADEETKGDVDSGELSVNKAYKKVKDGGKLSVTVHLAYDVEPDASMVISKAGKEYATKLALAILQAAGHEVKV